MDEILTDSAVLAESTVSAITVDNTAFLEAISADVHQLNIVLTSFLVIIGILLSTLLCRFLWRFLFKPALRFIRLPL